MENLEFLNIIKYEYDKHDKLDPALRQTDKNIFFLTELDNLASHYGVDESIKMTQMTIFFEGFYRHVEDIDLKQALANARVQRWMGHFGTPTIPFLLSYKNQIDQTKKLFDQFDALKRPTLESPWIVEYGLDFTFDNDSNIIADPKSISQVSVPPSRELTGMFTKTHNPLGGFTTTPCDFVSQQFIEHAARAGINGGKVLEIGAAFGAATLEAIAKGATVFCNDIDAENLAVVRQRFLETTHNKTESITGDDGKLILIPGELPHELIGLPEKFFDAILICRVLHFFSGKKIDESLILMSALLAPGGKIYIVCETPYLKNWQQFIPEFNRRVENGEEWPGEITNPTDYESSGRAASLPEFVHWITKEILERSLSRAGFFIEHSAYINRAGQFPEDLLLPEHGKESVGAIGLRGYRL